MKDYKASVTIITTMFNFTICNIISARLTQRLAQCSGDSIDESESNIIELTFCEVCVIF